MSAPVANGVGTGGTRGIEGFSVLLRVADLARAAGVRKRVVYAAIHSGRLRALRLGCRWRIHPAEAERWAHGLALIGASGATSEEPKMGNGTVHLDIPRIDYRPDRATPVSPARAGALAP